MSFHVPNQFRLRSGPFGSDDTEGNNGAFFVPRSGALRARRDDDRAPLKIIASDGKGWEHVSVSLPTRCPTWAEMSFVKGIFWDDCDCVVQFHPPASEYVNNHPYCLHLWRQVGVDFPLPPSILVGVKALGELARPSTTVRRVAA